MPNQTNQEIIEQWSTVTPQSIDEYGNEGDISKKNLLNPAIFELLGDIQNIKILEVGIGGGYLSRLMAKKGAKVTGLEPSSSMYQYAVNKEKQKNLGIELINQDLSQMTQFNDEFDAVVANMVFLDIPDWKSAMANCIQALKPDGKFVFSLWHPCFFSNDSWNEKGVVEVKEYFEEYAVKATWILISQNS
jgi:2-polyprenyl-3-methyl-5-hydroxy-6-metoxy-1,4-benzoquinol methylase